MNSVNNPIVKPRKRRINPLAAFASLVRPRTRPTVAGQVAGEVNSNVIVFRRRDTRTAHCAPRNPNTPDAA